MKCLITLEALSQTRMHELFACMRICMYVFVALYVCTCVGVHGLCLHCSDGGISNSAFTAEHGE